VYQLTLARDQQELDKEKKIRIPFKTLQTQKYFVQLASACRAENLPHSRARFRDRQIIAKAPIVSKSSKSIFEDLVTVSVSFVKVNGE
jgi:hypothetical protein